MQIIVPLAASDRFFDRSEYHFPKPLIEIGGAPMIKWVVDPVRLHFPGARFIFIVRAEDCRQFDLDGALRQLTDPDTRIIRVETATMGAVCSCLLAVDALDPDDELLIMNGDQVIEQDLRAVVDDYRHRQLDAGVIAFDSVHPRWSYIRPGDDGLVHEAAEKRVISRLALTGFYYYARSRFFVDAAMNLIRHAGHVNGTYYIAPTLNEMILADRRVGYVRIEENRHHSFYSPQKVEQYERTLQNRSIAAMAKKPAPAGGLNIVIPMAGRGSCFAEAGYRKPKPFIDVAGRGMIERVMENLAAPGARYILLAQRAHLEAEPDAVAALERRGDVTFLPIDFVTEGAACTVLLARSLIDAETPLLIANCDQIVDFDCADYVADGVRRGLDGSILTFREPGRDPKWSYARIDGEGLVREVKEKVGISDLATVGLYYFRRGRDFVAAAVDMIARNDRTKNEFYVCPVYNYAIAAGRRIGVYEVGSEAMHGIGTPEDLALYLEFIGA